MEIKQGTLIQNDLEYIVWYAVLHCMKNTESVLMHDFLTSLEGLVPCFSNEFLRRLKHKFNIGVIHSTVNNREFQDMVDVINKELESRLNG